jgi:hypothetical protein
VGLQGGAAFADSGRRRLATQAARHRLSGRSKKRQIMKDAARITISASEQSHSRLRYHPSPVLIAPITGQ